VIRSPRAKIALMAEGQAALIYWDGRSLPDAVFEQYDLRGAAT